MPLPTAVAVIHWVHRLPADARAPAESPIPSGAPNPLEARVGIPNLSNRRRAGSRDEPNLPRRELQLGVRAFDRHELHGRSGTTCELPALSGLELDRMHVHPDRNLLERETIPDADRRRITRRDDGRADLERERCDDVRHGPIGVLEEREPRVPIRIVLDCLDGRRHIVARPKEIHDPNEPRGTAASVAHGDHPTRVPPRVRMPCHDERPLGTFLRDVASDDRRLPSPGNVRCVGDERHKKLRVMSYK